MASNTAGEIAEDHLYGSAIDTLPLHLAIVDSDGTIRTTNRAWQEFGEANGIRIDPDTVGVNYLEVTEGAEDEHATRAAAGLRDVLDGDRERFEMEYPCHAPDEPRWFLLRASPIEEDGKRYASVAHIDITERKLREQSLEAQRDELAQLQRLNMLVRRIMQALPSASTREELERAVCEQLTDSDIYQAVWIGARGQRSTGRSTVVPQTAVGIDESYLERIPGTDCPAWLALRTGDTQVVNDIETAPEFPETQRQLALEHGFRALAAVPLTAGNTSHGVLAVYAPEAHTIGDAERDVLADLGEIIGLAIQRVHSQRSLSAETVLELDVHVPDAGTVFGDLSRRLSCECTLDRRVPTDGKSAIYYVSVSGVDPSRAREELAKAETVTECTLVREGNEDRPALLEVHVDDESSLPAAALADFGGSVTEMSASDGSIEISAKLPPEVDVRRVLGAVGPSAELVGKHLVDRSTESGPAIREQIRDQLTPKQEATLEAAQARGYYSWPRESTAEELADALGISAPTLHYRLRRAHQTVLSALLDSEE